MEIKVESTYDYDANKKFARFFIFRGKYYKVKRIISFIILILFTAFCAYYSMKFDEIKHINFCVLCFVWFVNIYIYFIRPKSNYKKNKFKNVLNTFIFKEDSITISSLGNGINGSSDISYSSIRKIFETDDAFYIFISANQAFLINKKNNDKITINDLRNLLSSKLPPKKYIICN